MTGDQYLPSLDVASAIALAGYGPKTGASALPPTSRIETPGTLGACIANATRIAAAPSEDTSTRAARPPSGRDSHARFAPLIVRSPTGTSRPKPIAKGRPLPLAPSSTP